MTDENWLAEQAKALTEAINEWPDWAKKLMQAEEQKDLEKIEKSRELERSKNCNYGIANTIDK